MALPATLFLEGMRPMNFLGSQAVHFFNPVLSVVFDFRRIEAFGLLLEKRGSVDLLLGEIEVREEARRERERLERLERREKRAGRRPPGPGGARRGWWPFRKAT